MGRRPCCAKEGLNRGPWSAQEDHILINYIQSHGDGKWRDLPKNAGLKRCGKSCRLRWLNYLRPDIKRGNISVEEEELIIRLHKLLGNRWSLIAGRLPGRTDNEIKNYWNTKLRKRVQGKKISRNSKIQQENSKDKTKCSQNPSGELKPFSGTSNRLFRTKATRCTKVIMFPDQPPDDNNNNNNNNNYMIQKNTGIDKRTTSTLQEDHLSDLLLDLDISELLLSDQIHDEINNNGSLLSHENNIVGAAEYSTINSISCLDFPVSTFEAELVEVLMDNSSADSWSQWNPFQANDHHALDINNLTSFPSLEDEWII